jgi:hypothetical protein
MRIKGHTEIQLTDVRTGKVKTFHDDNMMTNGLAEFMKNHGMLCGTPFTDAVTNDLVNTLLGGILLFDTALTENVNNTRLTDGIKMTANACHGVTHTGDPTELGSYDANESGWQNAQHSVYRHVYTWTTSQGNGRIACACLTSKPHGYIGEGNSTSKTRLVDSFAPTTYASEVGLLTVKLPFMVLDNEIFYISYDGSGDTLTISKHHVTDTECDMRDIALQENKIVEDLLTINNPTATALGDILYVCARVLTNSVVISLSPSWGQRRIVLTFPRNFSALTSYVEVTTTATSITEFDGFSFLTADATHLIARGRNAKVYKINLSNLADVSEVATNSAFTNGDITELYSTGKRHCFHNCIYDETLNAFYPINAIESNTSAMSDIYKDDCSLFVRSTPHRNYPYDVSGGRRNDYLATINNLSSPVTKDSTQTMKVIYTLTFIA